MGLRELELIDIDTEEETVRKTGKRPVRRGGERYTAGKPSPDVWGRDEWEEDEWEEGPEEDVWEEDEWEEGPEEDEWEEYEWEEAPVKERHFKEGPAERRKNMSIYSKKGEGAGKNEEGGPE